MTTIAYRLGVMAADRQAYLGKGETGHSTKTKIFKLEDGSLCGVSSSVVGAASFLRDWLNSGGVAGSEGTTTPADFTIMIVNPDEKIYIYHDGFFPTQIEADYMAIGSGSGYALGAMFHGANAADAIKAASKFDPFTGGGIDELMI